MRQWLRIEETQARGRHHYTSPMLPAHATPALPKHHARKRKLAPVLALLSA